MQCSYKLLNRVLTSFLTLILFFASPVFASGEATDFGAGGAASTTAPVLESAPLLGALAVGALGVASGLYVFTHQHHREAAPTAGPTVILTAPANAATGVPPNSTIAATFSEDMDPVTINTTTFTVMLDGAPVVGTVTYSGRLATFTPANPLTYNAIYTATITTGAKNLVGNNLISNYTWSFQTIVDVTRPTVIASMPINGATNVAVNTFITADFSKAMDPTSINTTTFLVKQGTTPIAGTVTYSGVKATFAPSVNLARNTVYNVTITTGAKDLVGNALAGDYTWIFQTTATPANYVIHEDVNPVFDTIIPDQAYVIKDNDPDPNMRYKFYYADTENIGGNLYYDKINLATSPNGIVWTPYAGNPILNEGHTVQQEHANVQFYSEGFHATKQGTYQQDGTMYYRMWYQGAPTASVSVAGWKYAESADGIHWYNRIPVSEAADKPVYDHNLPPHTQATGINYGIASVIYTPGGEGGDKSKTFRIYANLQWEDGPYSAKELVVLAYSEHGYDWWGYDPDPLPPPQLSYAKPVFAGTLDGTSFDADHVGWFKVIKNSDTDWEAFYSGGKDTTYQNLNGIGYATSTDGINWTRRQTLLVANGGASGEPNWRKNSTWMPSVVKNGNNYELFFLGADHPIVTFVDWKLGRAVLTLQ
jgi:hypothetical protein